MTTVRKLRHPLVAFFISVLTVIAIGVGAVAAVPAAKLYGPSWGRFTAVFPDRVQERPATSYLGQIAVDYDSSTIYEGQNHLLHGRTGTDDNVSVAQLSELSYKRVLREMALGLKGALPSELPMPESQPPESAEHLDGFQFLRLGPLCRQSFCEELLIAVRDRTIWVLRAWSFVGSGAVESFVDSFQPIG